MMKRRSAAVAIVAVLALTGTVQGAPKDSERFRFSVGAFFIEFDTGSTSRFLNRNDRPGQRVVRTLMP